MELNSRYQKPKESVHRFIDALETLSEFLQSFVAGVKDRSIHTMLITTYCNSRSNCALSIEELRKTVKEFVSWNEIRQEDKNAVTPSGAGTRIIAKILQWIHLAETRRSKATAAIVDNKDIL